FRRGFQRQGFGGGNDLATEGQGGQFDRSGAGGDDDVFGADDLFADFGFDDDSASITEVGMALYGFDARLLEEAGDAGVKPADDAVFPGNRLREVDGRRGERNAERIGTGGNLAYPEELIGGMDQRLGG